MLTVYGDSISGNCLKVKWTADHLGVPYSWVETSVLAKETRSETFLAMNPAGQVPIIKLENGEILSQSNAIILYLSNTFGGDLLPKGGLEYGRVLQWMFWEQYSHETAIAVRRFHKLYLKKNDDQIDPVLLDKGNAALQIMDNHLQDKSYFVGGKLTAADIALLAYTRMAPDGGYDLDRYNNVTAWIAATERELGLSPYQGGV